MDVPIAITAYSGDALEKLGTRSLTDIGRFTSGVDMNNNKSLAGLAVAHPTRKSRWPARLDWLQSVSGLILALFMWGHMFFVSSILLGKDAMWTVAKFFEGYFFFGQSLPWMVSIVVAVIFALVIGHALLAVRKFPINYGQYRSFRQRCSPE